MVDTTFRTTASSTSATLSAVPDRLPTLREFEHCLIAEALRRADGNQGVAAGPLSLSRQALNKRLSRRREEDGGESTPCRLTLLLQQPVDHVPRVRFGGAPSRCGVRQRLER